MSVYLFQCLLIESQGDLTDKVFGKEYRFNVMIKTNGENYFFFLLL